ncbi:histidine phosphatase family protein [Micromonospora sp. WMMD1082]|uniref:histidine phosphatase family protein n=1 Tax=Micromonospora sp. WMMD1082 TaxID=3016104 RepID=UPI002415B8C4|nr:histidine phosphatase family protein [Micromonospora sp. WMMD1082]MDG4797126.1 histidine phosphatase family protein [Micromonospora sp. WMMD1082]
MKTRLVLVSHAPTAATRAVAFPRDEPLDAHGLADATALAQLLPRADEVRCGPARRCVQTAAALGLAPTVDDGLRDADLGRWAGRTLDDLVAERPAEVESWLTEARAAPHGGESLHDLLDRTGHWLRAVPGTVRTLVAVTHPMVIRALVVNAIGAGPASFWRIDIAPLTATVLRGDPGRWTLRTTAGRLDHAGRPGRRRAP